MQIHLHVLTHSYSVSVVILTVLSQPSGSVVLWCLRKICTVKWGLSKRGMASGAMSGSPLASAPGAQGVGLTREKKRAPGIYCMRMRIYTVLFTV